MEKNRADLAASLQHTIIDILLNKLRAAMKHTGINQVALAGGVSANSGLRSSMEMEAEKMGWELFNPPFIFTTDNAAMIAGLAYLKYNKGEIMDLMLEPCSRLGNIVKGKRKKHAN